MFDLIKIRRELHQKPELSGNEKETSKKIIKYLESCNPDKIITDIGGYGIIAVFETDKPGPSVLLRAELDALPINEENNTAHTSKNHGVSHSCGHDGHMSILLGVAEKINQNKNTLSGRISLLFQPSEENAEGAKKVTCDPRFKDLKLDYVFALHNLPGFKTGSIILRKDVFAATSKGIKVWLKGKSAHAGQPENGKNPIYAITEIIQELKDLSESVKSTSDRSLITIIHVKLGKIAFGTSPGDGVVMATYRSTDEEKMKYMTEKTISLIKSITKKHELESNIEWVEVFPLLVNDNLCIEYIESVSRSISYDIKHVQEPFSWTEDFSYYLENNKGAFFGIGAGENHSQLHNPDYDFPDELIPKGVNLFYSILKDIDKLKNNKSE